jgi:hypothetical protein
MEDRQAIAIAVQVNVPTLIWGSPGTGKTAFVVSLAEFLQRQLCTVMASVREPQDFAGLPIVDHANNQVVFALPEWAKSLKKNGILFLDEASTAPPAVQPPMLRLVHERKVGDNYYLGDDVAILAAANPPEQAAGGWDLAPPLANRFFHVDWDFSPIDWTHGFLAGWPMPALPKVPANWREKLPEARSLVASFINKQPSLALDVPSDESKASKAWPSPRSWDMTATLLAAALSVNASEELKTVLVAGCVGTGAAAAFVPWCKEQDLPDPEALLRDPKSLKLPSRGDRAYTVLASVISAVAAKNSPERWEAAARIIAIAGKDKQDVAAQGLISLVRIKPPSATPPNELGYLLTLFNAVR